MTSPNGHRRRTADYLRRQLDAQRPAEDDPPPIPGIGVRLRMAAGALHDLADPHARYYGPLDQAEQTRIEAEYWNFTEYNAAAARRRQELGKPVFTTREQAEQDAEDAAAGALLLLVPSVAEVGHRELARRLRAGEVDFREVTDELIVEAVIAHVQDYLPRAELVDALKQLRDTTTEGN